MKIIAPSELQKAAGNALLLDVRTPAEFESAHLEGARLEPLDRLEPEAVRAALQPGRICVTICQSGGRARKAAEKLEAAGVPEVSVLDGGIGAWIAAGFPVVEGRKTISLERQVRIGAGLLVLAGVALGTWVEPWFYALSGFVGAGLIFAGITNTCCMGMLLARMPWNRTGGGCCRG